MDASLLLGRENLLFLALFSRLQETSKTDKVTPTTCPRPPSEWRWSGTNSDHQGLLPAWPVKAGLTEVRSSGMEAYGAS